MFSVTANTIAEAWEASIEELLKLPTIYTFDSDRGYCIEAESVTLYVMHPPLEPQLSERYLFPQLIEEYKLKVAGKISEVRTTYERMHQWLRRDKKKLNQRLMIKRLLRSNPQSRAGVLSLWDPEIDLNSSRPISPCMLYFSVRNNLLNLAVIARSTDAWVGALPEMIAFSDFQAKFADELGIGIGRMSYHALSYHLYEYDLPTARQSFAGG